MSSRWLTAWTSFRLLREAMREGGLTVISWSDVAGEPARAVTLLQLDGSVVHHLSTALLADRAGLDAHLTRVAERGQALLGGLGAFTVPSAWARWVSWALVASATYIALLSEQGPVELWLALALTAGGATLVRGAPVLLKTGLQWLWKRRRQRS